MLSQCRRIVTMWEVMFVGMHRNRPRRIVQKWRNPVYMEQRQGTFKRLDPSSFCNS